jgi:hypothetical protein
VGNETDVTRDVMHASVSAVWSCDELIIRFCVIISCKFCTVKATYCYIKRQLYNSISAAETHIMIVKVSFQAAPCTKLCFLCEGTTNYGHLVPGVVII